MNRKTFAASMILGALSIPAAANAAIMTSTLGNDSPGFNDGDATTLAQLTTAQSGQPAPFDAGKGNDVLLNASLSESWQFTFAAVVDPIVSATLTLGIADHDSEATGNQVSSYTLDGNSLTADLNSEFEGRGGSDTEYNVYSLVLNASLFTFLADGNVSIALALNAPGLVTPLFPLPGPNPAIDSASNGAFLVFSSLTIETSDGTPVPEPTTLSLAALGLGGMMWRRRRRGAAPRQIS